MTRNPSNPIQPGTNAPCTVTGGSLVLEFQSLYLRAPVAPEETLFSLKRSFQTGPISFGI